MQERPAHGDRGGRAARGSRRSARSRASAGSTSTSRISPTSRRPSRSRTRSRDRLSRRGGRGRRGPRPAARAAARPRAGRRHAGRAHRATTARASATTARRPTASSPTSRRCASRSILYAPRAASRRASSARRVRHVDILPTDPRRPRHAGARGAARPEPARRRRGPVDGAPPSYFEALSPALNRGWAPLHGVLRDRLKYHRPAHPRALRPRGGPAGSRRTSSPGDPCRWRRCATS